MIGKEAKIVLPCDSFSFLAGETGTVVDYKKEFSFHHPTFNKDIFEERVKVKLNDGKTKWFLLDSVVVNP